MGQCPAQPWLYRCCRSRILPTYLEAIKPAHLHTWAERIAGLSANGAPRANSRTELGYHQTPCSVS